MSFATLFFSCDKTHFLVQVVDGADALRIIEKVCSGGMLRTFFSSL